MYYFRLIYIITAFLLLTAAPFSSVSSAAESSASPACGDRILFGSIGEPSNLIPFLSTDSASQEISGQLFVAPLRFNKELQIEPWAASTYEIFNGGKGLRFTLRQDIRWEDGVPLTADDVEFTYRFMIDPRTPTAYAEDYLAIKEFRKTGTYSFEVVYDKVFARALMTWLGAILPKHCLEGQDLATTPFLRHPIGAGPFKLKLWQPGSQVVLTASESYFEGRPYLDEAVYRIIPDNSTMFLELKAGRLDTMNLSPQQYLRQTTGKNWENEWNKYRYLSFGYTFLGYNLDHPFFQDVRVRRALSLAIDREALVKGVLLGQGIAAFGPYKPGTWAYNNKLAPLPYAPEQARRLLNEAGWKLNHSGILEKDGISFVFTILTNQGNDQRIKTATIIQSQLASIGIKVHIRTVEWAAFIKEFVDKRRFDAVILGWSIVQDPDLFDVWHSSRAVPGGLNFTNYRNAEADDLLVQARSTTDRTLRKKLYDRFQEILHEDQPYSFLYVPYSLPIVQNRFKGIEPAPAGIMYNFDKWWVPKALQRHALLP